MGFWDKFTKTAVEDPITGKIRYFDSPAVAKGFGQARAEATTAQPALADVSGTLGESYLAPGFDKSQLPLTVPDVSQVAKAPDQTTVSMGDAADPAPPPLKIFKPSFEQASENQYGLPAKNTPGLTRLGKLMQVLVAAGKGAVAGQAASAQAVAASGGHRGGSFGLGFEAAERAPFEDIAREQNAQQGAIATQMAQQNLQPVQTPWGMMPMWQAQRRLAMQKDIADIKKAGIVTPRNGGVYNTQTQQYEPGTEPMDKTRLPVPGVDIPFPPEVMAQKKELQDNKPDTGTQVKQEQSRIISKLSSAGELLPGSMTDVNTLMRSINQSKVLTQPEKDSAMGYLATNTTPASQGTVINLRADEFAKTRGINAVLDTKTGITSPMSWDQFNKAQAAEPGRYVSPQWDAEAKAAMASASAVGRDMPVQVRSFGQFLGHAADLSKAVNDLGNTNMPLINRPYNWLRNNAGGSPAITNFLAKVDPVRKEFESFLVNNRALTVDDRERGKEILAEDRTPAQMQAAIRSFMHTALVRLDELNQSYYTQTQQDYPGIISPKGAKVLEDFGFGNEVKVYRQRGMIGGSTANRPRNAPTSAQTQPQEQQYPGVRFTPIQ